ncbi:MAG: BON domain-containing protein [Paludibacterium sp.]|uniref:BON domain-containing protein n=1 Tax=Paludibacterium sp. TaxID=1917523 RepID=UPI0025D78733|nr:BON domain-containing protein [Paludibacterium sp.]MBV8046721.1 BON domain-containing protein [Paludibacterium sp.]MBV8645776.1 BON domain-containing protein [Paludibacterium sp.]
MNRRPWMTAILVLGLSSALSGCFFPLLAGGVAGTAMVASDRRTSGAYLDDKSIELKGGAMLSDKFPSAHVNLNSFNRTVLLTGEMQSEDDRNRVALIAGSLPGVKRVENYTVVADPSTFSQRNNDTWITSKARSRLMGGEGNYSSQAIKIVTERGVVYLMGLVTRPEGDAAAAVVSQTAGVLKVVTLFEYLNEVPPLPANTASSSAQ